MTATSSFRPGRRRSRSGRPGLRRAAFAPLALAALGFVVLLGAAPAAGQLIVINQDDFRDVVEGDAGTNTAYPIRVWLRESGSTTPATATSTVDFEIRPSSGFRLGPPGATGTGVTLRGPATGTLTFLPGESEQTVNYVLVGDDDFEGNEIFTFAVLRPTGSARFDGVNIEGSKTGRIVNDDFPTLSITSTSTPEGAQGSTTTLAFTVTLDLNGVHHAPGAEFKYRVTGGTATVADGDYVAVPGGTLQKPKQAWHDPDNDPSSTEFSWTIPVTVNGDNDVEEDETVEIEIYDAMVQIADPNNLTGGSDNTYPVLTNPVPNVIGTGMIVNDDQIEAMIDSPSVVEGDSGTTDLEFTVRLNGEPRPGEDVELRYRLATDDGTATVNGNNFWDPGEDYGGGSVSSAVFLGPTAHFQIFFRNGEPLEKTFSVTVNGDDRPECNETVVFSNVLARNVNFAGSATATGTIIDDDDGSPEISIDSPSVEEGAAGTTTPLAFTVSLSPEPWCNDVTVDWAVTGGEAMAGADYPTGAQGTARIPAWERAATFDVTVNGDDEVELDERVTVTLSNPTGSSTFPGGASTIEGTGTIRNDDIPDLSVSAPAQVTEGGAGASSSFAFTVSLSTSTIGEVMVDYALTGDAEAGTDYQVAAVTDTLTFAIGETSKTVEVRVTGDDTVERDETVVLTLSNLGGPGPAAFLTGGTSSTVTIRNDDLPLLTVATSSVVEGDDGETDLVFTITKTPATAFVAGEVQYIMADGDSAAPATSGSGDCADPGVDYEDHSGVLTFPPEVGERTITVKVCGDRIGELDEDFSVRFHSALDLRFSRSGLVRIDATITDDDDLTLEFEGPTEPVYEGQAGTTTFPFTLALKKGSFDASSSREVTGEWALTGGGDVDAADLRGAATGTFTIPVGSNSAMIEVPVAGDREIEADETVEITLSGLESNGVSVAFDGGGASLAASARILNDDLPPFLVDSVSVTEGATGTTATLRFTVRPDGNLLSEPSLTWTTTASGTAVAGEDFEAASGTVTFASGDTSQTFEVTVIGDERYELDEVMEVEVLVPGTTTPVTGRGTIMNDDPRPRVSIDSPSVREGDDGETTDLVFTLTMDRASHQAITVNYETATKSGTATPGESSGVNDFHGTGRLQDATFDSGSTTRTISVTVNGDNLAEEDETVTLHIVSIIGEADLDTSGLTMAPMDDPMDPDPKLDLNGTRWLATGTILDDEPEVSIHSLSVLEGASGTETTANLRFTLDRVAATDVDVAYALASSHPRTTAKVNTPDTGFTDDDDLRFTTGVVVIPMGSTMGSATLTVRGDNEREGDETALFMITEVVGHAKIGAASSATVTILDDEFPVASIDSPSVVEGDSGTTDLVFTVALSPATPTPVTVHWRVSATSTAETDDYTLPASPVTVPANATSTTITVTVRGDERVERDETVVIELTRVTGGNAELGTPRSGTGTIRNDDFPELTVATSSVAEGDSGTTDLAFTLSLSGPTYEDVTVEYALGGTATDGADYGTVAPVSPLTIPAGTRELTVTVSVTGDTAVEPDETVTLTFSNLAGGLARFPNMASTLVATGTIRTDDIPTFSIDSPSVDEGMSGFTPLVFTVSLAPTGTVAATVDWAVTGGTAEAGTDYRTLTPPNGTLTFAPGVASMALPEISVWGDEDAEPNETVVITLSPPPGGTGGEAVIGEGVGTGTIRNDDSLTVSVDSPSVNEGDSGTTELQFTMELSQATGTDVTFRYEVTDAGTAESGADYRPRAPGRLTIPARSTTVPLAVQVVGDDEWEPDETVVVRISDPLLGGRSDEANLVIGTATGTGTIVNDDLPRLSIDSPEAEEGSGTLEFTVSLQAATSGDVTVEYVLGGDATHGDDYTGAASGTVTIPRGSTTTTLAITLVDDGIGEPHETLTVTLRNPVGAGLRQGRETGTGRILNDDLPPLTVAPVSVPEGDAGDNPVIRFNVVRQDIRVREEFRYEYEVAASSTARQNIDFTMATTTLVFPVGSLRETIEIEISGDDTREEHETVVLRIVNPSDGNRITTATGTILNDDAPDLPTVTVDVVDVNGVVEPAVNATTTLMFEVRLSEMASTTVAVDWETATGGDEPAPEGERRATADVDFEFAAETLRFMPGETSKTIGVVINGDADPEPDETVVVTLSNASGTEIWRGEATGVIRDGDPVLWLAGSPEAYESASGTPALVFEVRMSTSTTEMVSFEWEVVAGEGTADPDTDLTVATGTDSITAGRTSVEILVSLRNDEIAEPDETVVIRLASSTNAEILAEGATAAGTIVDDDGALRVGIDQAPTVTEATGAELVFTVRLSASTTEDVTIPYEIDADRNEHLEAATGTVVIRAGRTSATIRIELVDDEFAETEDTVMVRLGAPTAAAGVEVTLRDEKETATGTVRDNDAETATFSTVSVDPGEPRTDGLASFRVNVLPPLGTPLTFGYEVDGGTLAAPPRGITKDFKANLLVPANESGAEFLIRPDAGARQVTFTVREVEADRSVARPNPHENAVTQNVDGGNPVARARALKYVLAGIGRTVATNIVNIVWDRAESHRSGAGGTHATVGGRRIDTRAFADDGDGALLRAAVGLAGDLLGIETDSRALLRDAERRLARGGGLGAFRDWVDLPDGRDLAGRTDFALPFANGEGLAPYTFWGRGDLITFESGGLDGGTLGDFSADGEVFAGHLGLDYRLREDLLMGVALSRTTGDVDYGFAGSGDRGGVETELTSLHPYLHLMSPDGLGVWGTLGYGTGSADLDPENGDTVTTDLTMEMLAFGVRDEFTRLDEFAWLEDVDLALKGDAFMAGISADQAVGVDAVDSDVFRVRAAVEGSTERVLEGGGLLAGRFELGARLDGGDAEEGFGADLAAGFDWAVPDLGLKVRGRGSMLLVHQESDFREWGLGLGLVWDPGVEGRGLRLSVEPTWHAPTAGGAAAMWGAGPGGGGGTTASARGASLDARLGYGMGVLDDRALATVFGELGRADGDARLRLGAGLGRPDGGGRGLGLELYGERRDRASGPDDSIVLKGRLGF